MKKFYIAAFYITLFNCASVFAQNNAPAWVKDNNGAFAPSAWISVVDSAASQNEARNNALSSLAQVFKVDVRAVTTAQNDFSRTVSESGNKRLSALTQSQSLSQSTQAETNVNGLIGVQTDFWTEQNGTANARVYANARMNKQECARRYSALVKDNSDVISQFIADAKKSPRSFRAAELLNTAAGLAVITDNYAGILSVLDSSTAGRKLSYGSAAQVKKLATDAASGIVISIVVKDDVDGRINRAFASFLKQRGFGSNLMLDGGYLLYCAFNLDDVETSGATKASRYTITMTLTDWSGNEVFAYSGNGRQNNNNQSEARQRALRAAEDSITKSGFGAKFDEYLYSQY
jgi:hypothetical protein